VFTLNNRPIPRPRSMAKLMLSAVYANPDLPARTTSWRFIPKPRPTMDACKRNADSFLASR